MSPRLHLRALPSAHRKALKAIRVETHDRLRAELRTVIETFQPVPPGFDRADQINQFIINDPDKSERHRAQSQQFYRTGGTL